MAVFGLGAVGLAACEGAKIAGASRIIGVDLNPGRCMSFPVFYQLDLATCKPILNASSLFSATTKKFGCTEFVNPKDHDKPVQEVLIEMTDGGVDRSVDNAMISAFESVHDGWGVAVLVGVPHKDAVFKTHPMIMLNEKILKGAFIGNYKPRSDLPNVVEMYMKKELEVEKFITHSVPFLEINTAFDLMQKGEGICCIILMDA